MDTEIKKCPTCGCVCANNQNYCACCGHKFEDYDYIRELFGDFGNMHKNNEYPK